MIEITCTKQSTYIKTEEGFSTISRKKKNGVYSIYTMQPLKAQHADMLDKRGLEVVDINFQKGLITFIRLNEMDYHEMIEHICDVLYEKETQKNYQDGSN